MIEKTFTNNEWEIELTSYIDNKQNIWSKGKDIKIKRSYKRKVNLENLKFKKIYRAV